MDFMEGDDSLFLLMHLSINAGQSTAASYGNVILVTALLVAGAGFIFTFIFNYSYFPKYASSI